MTMKNDAKFEEELTCHFKIDVRNSANFNLSTQKWKKINLFILISLYLFILNGLSLNKVYNVWVKKNTEEFDGTEDWCKI